MKPMNYPGRKNERRKRALARLSANSPERTALIQKIMPDTVARSVRTKKDRSARAKLARN